MRREILILSAVFLAVAVSAGAAEPDSPVLGPAPTLSDRPAGTESPEPPPPLSERAQRLSRLLDLAEIGSTRESREIARELNRFYKERRFEPAWRDDRGDFPLAAELLRTVGKSRSHGLDPRHYPLAEIEAALAEAGNRDEGAAEDLDLVLSDLFLTYARHLHRGRIDPRDLEIEWHVRRPVIDLAAALNEALSTGRVQGGLESLAPRHPEYDQFRGALAHFRRVAEAGGWPRVEGEFKVELGDSLPELAQVRDFLRAVGDMPPGPDSPGFPVLDGHLEEGVLRFQWRHGLTVDGVVGPRTLTAMRIPVEERIRTLIVNLERQRWLPDTLGTRHVLVNIPGFELRAVEEGVSVMKMRAITGTAKDQTPSFSDEITYMELNPRWNVPSRIAVEEILPKMRENPEYLTSAQFEVLDRTGTAVDPDSVAWPEPDEEFDPDSLIYRFRQASGPRNSLGSMKFMFPNRYAIYIHDTPKAYLFQRSNRMFSHGCVRLERPMDFADYLLRDDPSWERDDLTGIIESGKLTRINLVEPVPVHLLYLTTLIEDDGSLGLLRDIYGHDRLLAGLLESYVPRSLIPGRLTAALGSPRR